MFLVLLVILPTKAFWFLCLQQVLCVFLLKLWRY